MIDVVLTRGLLLRTDFAIFLSHFRKKCYTVVTPGLLQIMSKKCNSLGRFPGLVVFLAAFFRKLEKKSLNVRIRGVTIRESLL